MDKQAAYELGVQYALYDAGLLKTADEPGSAVWPAIFGPLGAGLAAQKGRGWEAAAKTLGGDLLGTGVGTVGGTGLGLLLSALSKGKIDPSLAARLGGGLGAASGGIAGRVVGYRHGTK